MKKDETEHIELQKNVTVCLQSAVTHVIKMIKRALKEPGFLCDGEHFDIKSAKEFVTILKYLCEIVKVDFKPPESNVLHVVFDGDSEEWSK